MRKRLLACFLALAMVLGMMPATAFSASAEEAVVTPPFTSITTEDGEAVSYSYKGAIPSASAWASYEDGPYYNVTIPEGTEKVLVTYPADVSIAGAPSAFTYTLSVPGYELGYGNLTLSVVTNEDGTKVVTIPVANFLLTDGTGTAVSLEEEGSFDPITYFSFEYGAVSCLSVADDAPTGGTIKAGDLYQVALNEVFADSEDHELTYSFETTVSNQHTKIQNDTFVFSAKEEGTYEVKLTAACGQATATHTLTITVEKADEGLEAQYNYDETDKSSVTVYVTLSNDGMPVQGDDGTVMAHLEVTVPYFDLSLYGLERYYRYGTENGQGAYTNTTVVKRPTGLHLYIYLLERYYLGLPEEECCLGTSGILDISDHTDVLYMNGERAYTSKVKALEISGLATSLFMNNFWGHDCNLMYFRNHCYPYMSAGWGATADYILLSDGDSWDVGLFTNWQFNTTGGFFACFDKDDYTADPGEELTVSTLYWGTTSSSGELQPKTGLNVKLYNSDWEYVKTLTYDENSNTLTFTAPEEAGEYYLLALEPNATDTVLAKGAPAAAKLTVGGSSGSVDISSYYDKYDFVSVKDDQGRYLVDIKGYTVSTNYNGDVTAHQITVEEGTETVYVTYPSDKSFVEYTGKYSVEDAAESGYGKNVTLTTNDDGTITVGIPTAKYLDTGSGILLENGSYQMAYGFDFVTGTITKVEVGGDVAVSRILLNTYEKTLVYNSDTENTFQITATVLPAEATGWTIQWTSSNEAVAKVDENGLVTAVGEGDAVITATIGEISASCTIHAQRYNTAPKVDAQAVNHTKVKTGSTVTLNDVSAYFTDEQGDELTFTAKICTPTAVGLGYEYTYSDGGTVTVGEDGACSYTFENTGVYALKITASDGLLETSFYYQVTVVPNDSGKVAIGDGMTLDIFNVAVVGHSEELVENFEIPYKGTHDTIVHHIVLSNTTIDGTPYRKMDIQVAEGYGWCEYASMTPGQSTYWQTRADIGLFAADLEGNLTAHFLQFHTECQEHTDENDDGVCDVCTLVLRETSNVVASGVFGENDCLSWVLDEDGKLTISGKGEFPESKFDIPWRDDYKLQIKSVVIESGTTVLQGWAFDGCTNLETVSIPDSVTVIGNFTFLECKNLQEVTIPESVTIIGSNAFKWCEKLQSVNIPEKVTEIGTYAFYGCKALTSIVIPDSVTTLGEFAFTGCSQLASVTLSRNLEKLSDYTFNSCTALTSIVIPDNVTKIWNDVFAYSGLESIVIGDNVTYMGGNVFDGCTKLKSVTIGKNVTSMGWAQFRDNTALEEVHFTGSAPAMGASFFKNVTATIYYPCNDESWTDEICTATFGDAAALTWVKEHSYEDGKCTVCGEADPESAVNALSAMSFHSTWSSNDTDYALATEFDSATKEYTLLVPDRFNACYVKVTLADGVEGTIQAAWVNLNTEESRTSTLTSGKSGQTLTGAVKTGNYKNTVTITVTGEDFTDTYTVNIVRTPTLTALGLDGIKFNETFQVTNDTYTATTAAESVTVTSTPRDESYTVTVNGKEDPTVALEMGENVITVVVKNEDGYEKSYTVTVTRKAAVTVSFEVNVENPRITLKDANNTVVTPVEGVYTLISGDTYTYTVQKDGYVGQTNSFTLEESGVIEIELDEATENPDLDKTIYAQWANFRNGPNHLGITSSRTPYAPEDAELLWAVKYGTGWAAAPGSPIMVDGDIITYVGSTIKRLDRNTGAVVAEGTMVASSSYSIVPATYADGMIFVGLSGGRIQAFNAKTLESLWVYKDELGGQPNCPITYKDGYIYAGFWNSETKDANFVCIYTIDEDHENTTESKLASWTYTRAGGFYWAGAYATDKFVVVGTDDGASGYDTNGASLLVFDRLTGDLVSSYNNIRGDIRSNVSYDPSSDRVFFTSKGGILCNAKVDWSTGKISDFHQVTLQDANGAEYAMSTCTPSVYNDRIYIGVCGTSQFGDNSGHGIAVYDLNADGTMTRAYTYAIKGYPQTSAMVTTAYADEDEGYVYIYLPYNSTPGGVSVLKDKKGQNAPLTTTDSGYSEVFTPVSPLSQYCICSTIADEYGTIYYKNDSCYMMAITSRIESLELTGTPSDDGFKAETHQVNGTTRDVTGYVETTKDETAGTWSVSYTYGLDHENYGLKTLTVSSVTLPEGEGYTVTGEATANSWEPYTFTVALSGCYEKGENFAVKVNGETVNANADGSYTVENVATSLIVTVEGVEAETITAYVYYATRDNGIIKGKDGTLLNYVEVTVEDFDNDGTFTMSDAFYALHEAYYEGGAAAGYKNETYTMKFWGANLLYGQFERNGSNDNVFADTGIEDGDMVAVLAGYGYNCLWTHFAGGMDGLKDTATAGEAKTFHITAYQANGAVGNVTLPEGATVTATCGDTTITTTVDANGDFTLTFPTAGEYTVLVDGSSTVSGMKCAVIPAMMTVTVENATYTVTLPEGEGYTVTGEATAVGGKSYTFTVELLATYEKGEDFAVKVNGEAVTANADGSYTVENVSDDLTVTVEGVKPITFDITVYYADNGQIVTSDKDNTTVLNFAPVTVSDVNGDGKFTMYDGFYCFHEKYHKNGAAGYTDSNWISQFWSVDTAMVSYGHNNGWVFSTAEEITDGDSICLFTYQDQLSWSDLYTYFDSTTGTAKAGEDTSFTVNGVSFMYSSSSANVTAAPVGATVTATKKGSSDTLTTTVGEDGTFTLNFTSGGTWTVLVSGKCTYTPVGGYASGDPITDAPIAPAMMTVTVEGATYTVTLPEDAAYTVSPANGYTTSVKSGESFKFFVEPKVGYQKGENFTVKADGQPLTADSNGYYTLENVTANVTITVEGVEAIVWEPVTVYFSISDDDEYQIGKDSKEVMALRKISVPYFDLGLYGLEDFYFSSEDYGSDGGAHSSDLLPGTAEYAYGKVTLLHLYIYALEVYYCGLDEDEAGQGYLYEQNLIGTDVLTISGSQGSLYMNQFWGGDENLNYYVNYQYPLASAGWGSTSDQILLREGDVITLGHFTSWSFYSDPEMGFNYLTPDEDNEVYGTTTVTQGDKLTLNGYRAGADMTGNYTTAHTRLTSQLAIYYAEYDNVTSDVTEWTKLGNLSADGTIVFDTTDLKPGTYVVAMAGQKGSMSDDICSTPGGIVVVVEEKGVITGDLNGDGEINVRDVAVLYSYINKKTELSEEMLTAADVNGDGKVDLRDATMLYAYLNGKISSLG